MAYDHCELEFYCNSNPEKGYENRLWDDRLHSLFLRDLPCVCLSAHQKHNVRNNVISIDDQQLPQQQCSCVDQFTKSSMDYLCPPLVDRQVEEFITEFYK